MHKDVELLIRQSIALQVAALSWNNEEITNDDAVKRHIGDMKTCVKEINKSITRMEKE